jgi:hypothetical protein
MNREAAIESLASRQQITDLIYRYCRSVDRLDVPLGHSIWHEDAIADYGADVYQGNGRGVIDHICAQHLHTLQHSHQVSNILIELEHDRRLTVRDFDEIREVVAMKEHEVGRRDHLDPSYEVLIK